MILKDTSVWVDHFRAGNSRLTELLEQNAALTHPFVIGELALGDLRQRELIGRMLSRIPGAVVATDAEVLSFIGRHALFGRGVGAMEETG